MPRPVHSMLVFISIGSTLENMITLLFRMVVFIYFSSLAHKCWTSTADLTRKYIDTNRARSIYRNDEPNSQYRDRRNKERVMMSYNITQQNKMELTPQADEEFSFNEP